MDGVNINDRLYTSTNTSHGNPLWIHEFGEYGNLTNRYLFKSELGLNSHYDSDTTGKGSLFYL